MIKLEDLQPGTKLKNESVTHTIISADENNTLYSCRNYPNLSMATNSFLDCMNRFNYKLIKPEETPTETPIKDNKMFLTKILGRFWQKLQKISELGKFKNPYGIREKCDISLKKESP